jgi:hypothetical protein
MKSLVRIYYFHGRVKDRMRSPTVLNERCYEEGVALAAEKGRS